MYICLCKAVTDKQIKVAIDNGHCSRKQLRQCLGVGTVCGKCTSEVNQLLKDNVVEQPLIWATV